MKILWLTWKDLTHPEAGGAEVVNEELAKRLVKDGHEVTLMVGGYEGSKETETVNGYKVIRLGNRYSVYYKVWRYYRRNLRGWADLVIDEVNTIPFFAKFYVKERSILFVHMLCRVIWFYQLPKWIGWIGYIAEPVYLRMLSGSKVITVSESTKKDLMRHGFKVENITIISEGIELEPVDNLDAITKYEQPTLLSLGSVRPMKRTLDQIQAFEIAKQSVPDLQLKVAGDYAGPYGEEVLDYIKNSAYTKDIEVFGKVSKAKKTELMQRCHILMVTSVKEGWCLVVTEANSQGTPAVVYDVDGLRDSVINKVTGCVVDLSASAMAKAATALLKDTTRYATLQKNAHGHSKNVTFKQSYTGFAAATGVSNG